MSSLEKGGRELAAAWLRRGRAEASSVEPKRRQANGAKARRPVAKLETIAVFHSDTHVSFSRA